MASSKRKAPSRAASSGTKPTVVRRESVNGTNGRGSKRQKLDQSNRNQLVQFITDYNMTLNELFQLKEYGSVVEWRPEDFASYNKDKPQLFEYFLKDTGYKLNWLDPSEEPENLDDLPLRLQKKVLAERDLKLLEKFPFKESVLEDSKVHEESLISQINEVVEEEEEEDSEPEEEEEEEEDEEEEEEEDIKPKRKTKTPAKATRKPIKQEVEEFDEEQDEAKVKVEEEILTEIEYPSDIDVIDTSYKLKDIKFKVPEPKVTHPSHIPAWRPPKADNIQDEENQKVIDFNVTPINLVTKKDGMEVAPEVGDKLRQFLEQSFKSAIIDDTANLDYNNTVDEYNDVLRQQKVFLKNLYQKVVHEKSLELKGEKIEKRKLALPQTNARQEADPFRSTLSLVPKNQGVLSSTHIDNLLSQGASFARIHQQVRKQRQLRSRKIAGMIDQHFRWKRGEKERIAREREQTLKKIGRLAVQAVKKRWTQAHKVYKYIQDQKEEELKKIKGREHLSNMLQHSTQLLEQQLNRTSSAGTETEDNGEESEGLGSNDSESSVDDTMDDNLTVDKLREKYSSISEASNDEFTNASSDQDLEDLDDDMETPGNGLAALYGNQVNDNEVDPEKVLEYTEEQKELILKLNSKEDKMLDSESDEESSLPDETSSDETTSSEDEESGSEEPVKENGLASLMSTNDQNDSDDESVGGDGFMEQSDDDRLSSTDEEDEPKTPKSDSAEAEGKKESDLPETMVNGSKVRDVPIPSLLRGDLRPYQKEGLNWLASLYSNDTNGILADEMGLGKTIQTISLLSHLATEYHIWGPHLIVVPTSVMLNWEMEFKKFAPGFKVLTYYGSPQQRAQKRKGWNKPNAFHVCITSYQLVVHDHQSFKRRRWRYMILDEAHNIKNFRSTRWKALLNFNTENRLLLTGTPLQNNLMELWSLLYFLMPSSKVDRAMPEGFANLEDFQTWFGKPVDNILEQASNATGDVIDENESTMKGMDEDTRNTVKRLHQVLRPYILRRLKKDVEKQMPGKYEHIIYCRLSQRQRFLYDDFMSRAKTKETLASGSFLSIINCLMQLRKVCNHPDLFEVRPIVTSLAMNSSVPGEYSALNALVKKNVLLEDKFKKIAFDVLNLDITSKDDMNMFIAKSTKALNSSHSLKTQALELDGLINVESKGDHENSCLNYYTNLKKTQQLSLKDRLEQAVYLNDLRCEREPVYGESLLKLLKSVTVPKKERVDSPVLNDMILSLNKRTSIMDETVENYSVLTPKVVSMDMKENVFPPEIREQVSNEVAENRLDNPFHKSQVKLSIAFPDKTLLQYDCGKLQKLDQLLQKLTSEGHRALIFTQMTKVLDILEQFLNIHGYRYLRLDGATKIEDRQLLTEKFNRDPKIPVFILSSRSGGLGINLTGADTVIFYDSDWNPAMDKQCQDRCHRIGQMRDVHIYRFVSEHTIESNILKKANQKRQLDNVVIQEGDFTTDYFGKFSVRDLVNDSVPEGQGPQKPMAQGNIEQALMQAEDDEDRTAATAAMKETAVDDEDFNEENPEPGPPSAKKGEGDDEDYEDGVGHIDEYMLRYMANGYYD